MGALIRTNLFMELLPRIAIDVILGLGWQGATAAVLTGLLVRGLRRDPPDDKVVCVATLLLVLLLIAGSR